MSEALVQALTQPVLLYGTLRNEATRKKVLGHDVPLEPGEILGLTRAGTKSTPDLKPAPGKDVKGVEMMATPGELKRLDAWEGSDGYMRELVPTEHGFTWAYSRRLPALLEALHGIG